MQHEDFKNKMQEQSYFLLRDEFNNFRNMLELESFKMLKCPELRLDQPNML